MAVSIASSSIVTDGLVLNLDPSDSSNYLLSEVEVLVVGGGGGGGSHHGGGGGGGGVGYNNRYTVTPGSAISVTVGNGGSGGPSGAPSGDFRGGAGGNSIFGNMTAIGGGGGGNYPNSGGSGGSGGGACNWSVNASGGSGTSGQGFAGANGSNLNNYGGGGGGASEPGGKGFARGDGGDGLPFSIAGTLTYYGGGGGAGYYPGYTFDGYRGRGGLGGGGYGGDGPHNGGTTPKAGTPNTGGGGGGVADLYKTGGAGGSGVVIVRYPGPPKATGGNTIVNINGYTIHTFTSSGTFTPLSLPVNSGNIYGLNDLSGNFNTAVSYASPTYNSANGGNINYSGSNYLEIKHADSIKPKTGFLTVISWFYATTVGSENTPIIFNKENEYEVAAGGGWVSMAVRPDWNWRRIASININQWYCVAITHDGVNQKGYLNGTLQYTNPVSGEVGASFINDLRIGARNAPSAASSFFTGIIGPIQVYNKALTLSEIQQNFNIQRGRFGI